MNDNQSIISNHDEVIEEIERRLKYREVLLNNIDYNSLLSNGYDKEQVDGLIEIMLDAICTKRMHIAINGELLPSELVKSKFLKIECEHIMYVLDCFNSNTTNVKNVRSYLLTSLYNATSTIGSYYVARVNCDLKDA